MKKLLYYHTLSMVIYLLGTLLPIGMFLLAEHLLNFDIPIIVLAVCAISCPLVSAYKRISVWKKRQQFLSPAVLRSMGARVYFMLIPAEFLVFIVGIVLLLI